MLVNFLFQCANTEIQAAPFPPLSGVKLRNEKEILSIERGRFYLLQIHNVSEEKEE